MTENIFDGRIANDIRMGKPPKQPSLAERIGKEESRVLSPEEARERENEILKRDYVTPELLTNFSPKEALELVRYFSHAPTSATARYDLYGREGKWNLDEEAIQFLTDEIKGKRVIEIGTRDRKNERFFKQIGAESYETTDPNGSGEDGLTYLMRQPEGSAIITSFGVLEDGVLYMDNLIPNLKEYTALLGREIYRVTPKGRITFHGLETAHDLINAGFKEAEDCPESLNSLLKDPWGGFRVLRK